MDLEYDLLNKAYKKLKSSVYYDKTQLILRDEIVEFESSHKNLDKYFEKLWSDFVDGKRWGKRAKKILKSIDYYLYPKKLKPNKKNIITNTVAEKIEIDEFQCFINMSVAGHIFGILWLLLIGCKLDTKVYEHAYGNRIRKKLINDLSGDVTYSPYLFEPYFEQYESWRDNALTYASKCLNKDQDVVIITMDFRRYYYSVDITKQVFDNILKDIEYTKLTEIEQRLYERINELVFNIIHTYSEKCDKWSEKRNILPIGFLPSNVLANWCLNNFDKAIVNGWNPVYYGRYVDDVLLVDKIEKNSDIYAKAKDHELSREKIISFFMEQCTRWKGFDAVCDKPGVPLLVKDDELTKIAIKKKSGDEKFNRRKEDEISVYIINPIYNISDDSKAKIALQNDKVKIFYFKSGESDALITCFRKNIIKNKSEFRFMPEDEAIFQDDDYSEIYSLVESDSINKLRGVEGVSIDKFSLSKFLGKYLRIGGLVNDKIESKFEKDISKIFNNWTIIENYSTWEKVVEIFVINNKYEPLSEFIKKIVQAISNINNIEYKERVTETLLRTLRSTIVRALSLNWGKRSEICLKTVSGEIKQIFAKSFQYFDEEDIQKLRRNYCKTRMSDKYVMPIMIDAFLNHLNFSDEHEINLTDFKQIMSYFDGKKLKLNEYLFYPYMVTIHDISIFHTIKEILSKGDFSNIDETNEKVKQFYINCNYFVKRENEQIHSLIRFT